MIFFEKYFIASTKYLIMTGEAVKEILRKNKISMKQLARLLDLTPQNLSAMLQKNDIRSGLVEQIAEKIGVPITAFYGFDSNVVTGDGNAVGNNSVNNAIAPQLIAEIVEQRKLTNKANEQIDRLLGIIEKMTKQ